MKYIVFIIVMAQLSLCADDLRGFKHFKAPRVTGAFTAAWNPLGPTEPGYNFSVGFYLDDGGESHPITFWISDKTKSILEVSSLAAINSVVTDMVGTSRPHQYGISIARKLVMAQIASTGKTALPLWFETQNSVEDVILRLIKAGLPMATGELLKKLGNDASEDIDTKEKKWRSTWYEVDKLGAIEKIVLQGTLEPVKVSSILREGIFDSGTVDPKVLLRENISNLNQFRPPFQ